MFVWLNQDDLPCELSPHERQSDILWRIRCLQGLETAGRYKPLMDGPRGHNNNKYLLIISTVREPWGLGVSRSLCRNVFIFFWIFSFYMRRYFFSLCFKPKQFLWKCFLYKQNLLYVVILFPFSSFQCVSQIEKNICLLVLKHEKNFSGMFSPRRSYFHSV